MSQSPGDALRAELDKRLGPVVRWLDRMLRRWPWLYERLSGPPSRLDRIIHAVLHPWASPLKGPDQ